MLRDPHLLVTWLLSTAPGGLVAIIIFVPRNAFPLLDVHTWLVGSLVFVVACGISRLFVPVGTILFRIYMYFKQWCRARWALVWVPHSELIALFCLFKCLNMQRIFYEILLMVLLSNYPFWQEHCRQSLLNFLRFRRFFLTKSELRAYLMNNMVELV